MFGIFIEPEKVFDYTIPDDVRNLDKRFLFEHDIQFCLEHSDHKLYSSLYQWYREMSLWKTILTWKKSQKQAQMLSNYTGMTFDWEFGVKIPFSRKYKILLRFVYGADTENEDWDALESFIIDQYSFDETSKLVYIKKVSYNYFDRHSTVSKVKKGEDK